VLCCVCLMFCHVLSRVVLGYCLGILSWDIVLGYCLGVLSCDYRLVLELSCDCLGLSWLVLSCDCLVLSCLVLSVYTFEETTLYQSETISQSFAGVQTVLCRPWTAFPQDKSSQVKTKVWTRPRQKQTARPRHEKV
jgi:hypothetical protein